MQPNGMKIAHRNMAYYLGDTILLVFLKIGAIIAVQQCVGFNP